MYVIIVVYFSIPNFGAILKIGVWCITTALIRPFVITCNVFQWKKNLEWTVRKRFFFQFTSASYTMHAFLTIVKCICLSSKRLFLHLFFVGGSGLLLIAWSSTPNCSRTRESPANKTLWFTDDGWETLLRKQVLISLKCQIIFKRCRWHLRCFFFCILDLTIRVFCKTKIKKNMH